jgi:hypothetical protein
VNVKEIGRLINACAVKQPREKKERKKPLFVLTRKEN